MRANSPKMGQVDRSAADIEGILRARDGRRTSTAWGKMGSVKWMANQWKLEPIYFQHRLRFSGEMDGIRPVKTGDFPIQTKPNPPMLQSP